VASWQERKQAGDRHETCVMRELEACGWIVHPCGQGTYPAIVQQALGRSQSALRYFPDLLAARGLDVVAVDCKTRIGSVQTGRFAISRACLRAGLVFLGANEPLPLYYVFGDLTVLTPAEVMHYCSTALRHPGGSYYLISTRHAHPFSEVFGVRPVPLTA
jgi:hypothetical protein